MPSEPSASPTAASPPDTALLEGARRGDRRALAMLYARHSPTVHGRAIAAGLAPEPAARVLRDVFRRASASLTAPAAASDPRAWVRGLAMDRIAEGRGHGPRLRPATSAAVRRAGPQLTPAVRDAVWREIEQEWHHRSLPLWRRQPAAVASVGLLGVLLAAAGVVGVQLREQIRPITPAGAVALTAEPVEAVATEEDTPPPPAPSVIVPPVETEEPFVPPPEPEETTAPAEPSPAPSESDPGQDPSPEPSPTETTDPTEDPSSPPLLPLPGSDDGSEDPSEDPSEPPSEDTTEDTAGDDSEETA